MIDNGIMALILLVANPGWIQGLFHFYRTFTTLPVILMERREFDGAIALLKEQERIYRERGYPEGLWNCLANQASALADSGDLDGAMAAYEEQDTISRQQGENGWLAQALAGKASVLSRLDRRAEASRVADEALDLAIQTGDEEQVEFVKRMKNENGL